LLDPARVAGWPDTLPPFIPPSSRSDRSALFVAPSGHILVRRLPEADRSGVHYDVFDPALTRSSIIKVPVNVDIVGVGRESIYAVTVDDDGLQSLARYRFVK
jgi:hypothetical protein